MKRILFLALNAALWSGICLAQANAPNNGASAQGSTTPQAATPQTASAPQASSSSASTASPVQSGSIIYAELSKSLDAKKAKVGDEVQAKAIQAVLSQGKVVIPKGAKIMGRVAQVTPKGNDQQPSQLVINFDHAILKDGTQVPLSVTLQALGGGPSANPAGLDQSPPNAQGNRGISSSGMPGRTSTEGAGGYGAPGGNMGGGMGSTNAGAGGGYGGAATTDTGSSPVHLNAGSRGVVGLSGLSLSEGSQGAVITSDRKNVKLDSGIELVLREK